MTTREDAAREAAALSEQLHRHAHLYYVLDAPELPDAEYDKLFQRLQGISGSTILGGGEVALILDIPSLIQHAIDQELGQMSQYAIPRMQTQPRAN